MTQLLVFVLCLAGFALLALAADRQQDDVFGRQLAPAATHKLRAGGWVLLLAALVALVLLQGLGMGLVMYSGHTSVAAGLVYGALIVHGRRRAAR